MKFLQTFLTVLLLTILPLSGLWAAEQKLTADDAASDDRFGRRGVEKFGNHAIIGCTNDDNVNGVDAGAVYFFYYNDSKWIEQQKVIPSDGIEGAIFGWSVDIYGDFAIVGQATSSDVTKSAAYIYHYTDNKWTFFQKLTPPSFGEPDHSPYGFSVSIYGDWAMVGMPNLKPAIEDPMCGGVYIYHYNDTEWELSESVVPSSGGQENQYFGYSIDIYEDEAVIGAMYSDYGSFEDMGFVYIFSRTFNNWDQTAIIQPADGAAYDYFGQAVSKYEDKIIVSSHYHDDPVENAGAAYIYQGSGSTWTQNAKLTASDAEENDNFGVFAVDIYRDWALVGTYRNNDYGENTGSIYAFQDSNGTWVEKTKKLASDAAANENFGTVISISEEHAFSGAVRADFEGLTDAGAVYVYDPIEDLGLNADPQISGLPDTVTMCINDVSKLEMEPYASDQNDPYDKLDWTFEESSTEITAVYSESTDTLTISSSAVKGIYYLYVTLTDPYGALDKDTIVVDVHDPSAIENYISGLPGSFALNQNYPNPFNPYTIINYELPITNYVKLEVYNLLGEKVETLVNSRQQAGVYTVEFNGAYLPSGVYFYKISAGEYSAMRKMILMK